ncbi:hypothetical protein [Blastococcus sp. SYSU DS0619]
MTRTRPVRVLLMAVGLAAMLTMLLVGAQRETPPEGFTNAADLGRFNPANIISDGVFYDTSSMNAAQIQNFLDLKGRNCTAGSMCLSRYGMATYTRNADSRCPRTYTGSAWESAASIISKVASACGINPQVLLVTLQKEMGLVTATSPTTKSYSRAMGYGCPDNTGGTCDATYNGFYNQVYMAARQFKNYQATPTKYGYVARMNNYIAHYPNNPGCGGRTIYIENQATAGLYNYTPYVPNQASLNAGYGTGDSCSSYGNRNFYSYFTDWFGSTQHSGGAAVAEKYLAMGGSTSYLGTSTGDVTCTARDGGCLQPYQGGAIYWSQASGAHAIRGGIYAKWSLLGYEYSLLGFPTSDEVVLPGGYLQLFQGGAIYWSPATGAHFIRGGIYEAWAKRGYETGWLGFPTGDEAQIPGGYVSTFQGGAIYWSASTGGWSIRGPVYEAWARQGYEGGPLGFPVSDVRTLASGEFSVFQGGAIYWSPSGGGHALRGPVYEAWARAGYETGVLGMPIGPQTSVTGGSYQDFAGGSIYQSSAHGARVVTGAFRDKWLTAGGVSGALGFPASDVGRTRTGTFQVFAQGAIYASSTTNPQIIRGTAYDVWARQGYETGRLGYPISDVQAVAGGQQSDFQGGSIYVSPATGGRWLGADLAADLAARGGPGGALGFPTTDEFTTATGGRAAHFQRGNLYWSAGTGLHNVSGPTYTAWAAQGYENGPLGYPTADATAAPGGTGTVATFQGGSIYWSEGTGAHSVPAVLDQAWARSGGAAGDLGLPTVDAFRTAAGGGGLVQHFQRGSIYQSAATGAHVVRGPIRAAWAGTGYEYGYLGLPVTDQIALTGGAMSLFQGGGVYWSPDGGAHPIRGGFYDAWARAGYEGGQLGYPTSDEYAVSGGRRMDFQGGTITVTTAGQQLVTLK